MKNIRFIKDSSEIQFSNEWVESEKFPSYGRVINRKGNKLGKDEKGRRFRLIAKMERTYSGLERVGRTFLGLITVICSIGFALFSHSIRGLFAGSKQVIRLAVPISSRSRIFSPSPLTLPRSTLSKVQSCMNEVIGLKDIEGIKFYRSQGSHRVFELSSISGVIFKGTLKPSELDNSIRKRYEAVIEAQNICREYGLDQLVIPSTSLLSVEFEGKRYDLTAEEKLDVNTEETTQEKNYEEFAESLNEAISQLAIFICKTGYSDVEWRNNPVLSNSLENGSRKIALLDLEEMSSQDIGLWGSVDPKRRGLIGCINEEQAKRVHKIAKWNGVSTREYKDFSKSRQKELNKYRQLQQFYQKNEIVDGKEQISADIIGSLGLDISEETEYRKPVFKKGTLRSKKVKVSMGKVAKDIINNINRSLTLKSDIKTVKGKRRVFLDMNHETLSFYKRLGLSQGTVFPSEKECKKKWPRRIIQALIDKGHAFELLHDYGNEYVIQL